MVGLDFGDTPVLPTETPAVQPNLTGGVSTPSPDQPVLSQTSHEAFGNAINYGLPSIGIGAIDTLGQSLHVFKNDTIPNALKNFTGSDPNSLGDFYTRNQAAMRATGEIAGMLLPGLAAMKALKAVNGLREAGSIGAWAKNSTALDVLLGNSAEMAASQGAITTEAETALYNQGIFAGRTLNTPAMRAAKLNLYGKKAADAVRTTAAFEVGNFAAFNSSQLFYPSDTTVYDQAKWAGLGLAGGVGLELAASRYAVRQMMRSVTNRMSQGAAADVFNLSPQQKIIDQVMFRPNERGVGLTAYAGMNADLDSFVKASDQSANLKTSIYQDQVNIKAVQTKQLGLMAYDSHLFVPRTQLTDGQVGLALNALKSNPTSLLSATKLGQLPEGRMADFYGEITKAMDKAKKDLETASILASQEADPTKKLKLLNDAALKFNPIYEAGTETHFVLEPTGGWTLFKDRAENWLDGNSFSSIKPKTYFTSNAAGEQTKNFKWITKADHDVILHDDFRIETLNNATPLDYSAMYAAGSKAIREWKPDEGKIFLLTPAVNWRQLEMTSALAKLKPLSIQQIKLGDTLTSLNDVDFTVLNGKFKEFTKLQDQIERAAIAPKGSLLGRAAGAEKFTPAQILQRLNLPVPNGMESSPVIEMFAHARLQGMKDLEEMFPKPNQGKAFDQPYTQLDLVKKHLQETAGVDTEVPFQGKLLEQPSDTPPIFVAAKALPELSIADANLQSKVLVMRDVHLEKLAAITPQQSPLVAGVMGKIFSASTPGGELGDTANVARAVQSLQDGILSGTGQVVYQDRINSQFPALKSLQLLAQDGDKFIDHYVEELAKATLTPRMANMLSPKNKSDLLDFNRVEQAYRHGWEILGSTGGPNTGRAGGTHIFELDPDSKINAKLKALHFPDVEPEDITHLPDMSVTAKKAGYHALEVSGAAGDLAHAISDLSRQSGVENNTLRVALGKNPIKVRDFHLPTPALNKEGTWFVYNPQGNVIATYTGTSIRENEQRAKDAATTLGKGHTAVPLETVKFDRQKNDDTFFDLVDFSDQLAKTGAGIRGGLAHTEIDTGPVTLKAMVRSLQEQFLNVGIRSRAAIFEPELNYARQAADSATALTRDNSGGFNIYDRYIATMFSQTPTAVKGADPGLISNAYRGLEDGFDRSLTWMYSHFSEVSAANETGKLGAGVLRSMLRARSSENEFRQFQKQLPSWSPFEDTAAWAESTFREKGKVNTKNLTGALSRLSSTMSLRFLDVGTAINNLAGLVTNMHSVTYALRRLPSESPEDWLHRTGAYGSQYVDGITTFEPNKALNVAIKAYWRGELNGPMNDAAKLGYFKPEYAALAKALTTPTKPSQKAIENFIEYGSKFADNSEMLSRKIAWGLGYKIGKDLHQFKDENNAYIFANNFVNQMIGNYSPNNKPAMFQGAVGLPLGTFQTYMFNFYRRLYENIETGNKAAIMAQYAAQASVFGWRSIPGYSAWNSLFQSNWDGSEDFTSRLRRTFSSGVGDLLLNGSVSNIPKIFTGLQGDALAFYTRGSVDFTQPPPTLLDMSKAPPIQFLTETWNGMTATMKNVLSGFSLQQQEEILANFSTNRMAKSIMEMAADAKTDKAGNVVQNGTRDAIHTAAAILGTQPASTRSLQEAYSRNQSVKRAQSDLRETLNAHTKAILRSGNFDTEDLQSVVQQYINARGNSAYLGQWFRNELMMATEPRTQKQLENLARSGKMTEFQDMLATLQQNQNPNIAAH